MTLDTLNKFMLLPQCEINRSTYTISLPNGSQFLFKGIDDGGEKIKSITSLTDIVIEEATEIPLMNLHSLTCDSVPKHQIFKST